MEIKTGRKFAMKGGSNEETIDSSCSIHFRNNV